MENVSIHTTQNVAINYEVASIGDRILATLLDYLFFLAYFLFIFILISVGINLMTSNIGVIIIGLPILFYDLACEITMEGQSFGKKIMKIKVTTLNGTQPSLGQYIIRWVFRLIDMRIFSPVVAIVAIAAGGKGQRLGDMAGGTTVIKQKKKVGLENTILHNASPNHTIVFTEVAELSDNDISIIKEVITMYNRTGNVAAVNQLATKVRETLKVQSDLPDNVFLETVLADYTHYQFDN